MLFIICLNSFSDRDKIASYLPHNFEICFSLSLSFYFPIRCLPVVGKLIFFLQFILSFRNNWHSRIAKEKRKYHQWKFAVTNLIECWCSIDGHEREIFMYSMSNITKNRKIKHLNSKYLTESSTIAAAATTAAHVKIDLCIYPIWQWNSTVSIWFDVAVIFFLGSLSLVPIHHFMQLLYFWYNCEWVCNVYVFVWRQIE